MKILRWPKARLRRNVIVVVSVTLLGLFGVKIYELRSSFTSIQPTVSSLDGSALKPSDDESVRRDETFTVEQSRIGSSESIEKSSHEESNVSNSDVIQVKSGVDGNPNPNVHLFYYGWYGNPQHDGRWWHWNHEYIPPWDKNDHHVYPTGAHSPPLDIGANFYPSIGAYSSRDPLVLEKHLAMAAAAGAGVLAVSWYPPGQADEHGPPSDGIIPLLLDRALPHKVTICIHVEPYEGRSAESLHKHLNYVHQTYGSHPAYHKTRRGSRNLPVFYIYDSYRLPPQEWSRLFSRKGDLSVRDTVLDGVFLGLLVEYKHRADIKTAGFDGFYTYFASDGFTYGSSWKNWRSLTSFARKSSLLFVPSVGPGYVDTRVRAWNGRNTKSRRAGKYYDQAWRNAVEVKAKMVSVTSFNEWHEGTQIEPAMPMSCGNYTYEDYGKAGSEGYLDLTSKWSNLMKNASKTK